jgi:hypothetical protein
MESEARRRSVQLACFQSCMATLLLVAIGSTIGGLIAAPDWCLPHKPTFATWKRQAIEQNLDAEVLILGSSHSHFGIVPRLLSQPSVNLANAAQDAYYNCALARRYVPLMPNLKRVLLEVEIRGWENTVERTGDAWRIAAYYWEFGIAPEQWNLNSTLELAAFRAKGPNFKKMDKPLFDDRGWVPREGNLSHFMGRIISRWHTEGIRSREIELHLKEVGNTIRECQARGIDVVLVRLPAHQCYREALDKVAFERLKGMTQELVRTNAVRYLDYYSDGRFGDEDFYDPDHLNLRGAEKFTRFLDHDLDESESVE